jgi:hypothetical protein
MTATTTHPLASAMDADRQLPVRAVCAASALAALIPFALASFSGESGAEITAGIVEDAGALQVASLVAVLSAAGLLLAAVRIGQGIGDMAGRVATAAGVAVAVLYAAYYVTFGAAGVVATQLLDEPSGALGESASLMLNAVEITRYAPGLALVVAAVLGRRVLSRAIWIPAAVLAVMTFVPFSSWVAALLIPLWLGLAAAGIRTREASVGS